MEYKHVPVMLGEVMEYLNPQPGQYFIDGTLGGGGYTKAIAEGVGEKGKVLGVDLDKMAIENFKFKILNLNLKLKNIILAHDNFRNLAKIVKQYFKDEAIKFDGVVFDLGLSSAQLQDRSRGFSFKSDAPLDMAFGQTTDDRRQTTEYIINKWSEDELKRIIKEYGEERFAKRIAEKIAEYRKATPIKTTGQLVKIIESAVPAKFRRGPVRQAHRGPIHFATRTFQALRIATNDELNNLREALPQAVGLLKKGGRVAAISYHSLEDRIVKQFFREESAGCVCPPRFPVCRCGREVKLKIITSKPLVPSEEEIKNNPRARSAKLRVAEKLAFSF